MRTVLHHLVQGTAGNIIADLRNDIVQQSGGGYDALLNLIKAVDSTKSFERGGTQLLSDYLITMIDLILINQEFLVSQQPAHLGNVTLCVNYFIKYGSAGQDDCSGATTSEAIKDDIGTLRTKSFQDCTQNTAGVGLQLTGDEHPCPMVCQPGTEWMARFFTVGIAALCMSFIAACGQMLDRTKCCTVFRRNHSTANGSSSSSPSLHRNAMHSVRLRMLFPTCTTLGVCLLILVKVYLLLSTRFTFTSIDAHTYLCILMMIVWYATYNTVRTWAAALQNTTAKMRFALQLQSSNIRRRSKLSYSFSNGQIKLINVLRDPDECTCRRGPVKWYSRHFSYRNGTFFYYRIILFEITEWVLNLATLTGLAHLQDVHYIYIALSLLLVNVTLGPLLFVLRLFQKNDSQQREITYLMDTVLDLVFLGLTFTYVTSPVDLQSEVSGRRSVMVLLIFVVITMDSNMDKMLNVSFCCATGVYFVLHRSIARYFGRHMSSLF